ncbi:bluf domain protein [Phaffia rhodozyma]|uniref:Bluf domain protein n=1 Tax=Phaffia rhodozyma TaxID=264483 RepID=A0A0F7SM29_PHARH|nr:bluf domain protein [Phaffia rhodozyma]
MDGSSSLSLDVPHLVRTLSTASTDSTVTFFSTFDGNSNDSEDALELDFSSFDPNGEIDEHEPLGEVDESDIFQLVFCSSSVSPALSKADMADIIEVCRRNNAIDAISGLLMYKDGQFVQILEGSEPRVKRTFSRIKKDQRHHAVYVLLEQKTKHRDFPRWPMAFRDMTWTDSSPPTPEATLLDKNGEVVRSVIDPVNKHTVTDSTASQLFTEDMNSKTKSLVVLYHKLYMRI